MKKFLVLMLMILVGLSSFVSAQHSRGFTPNPNTLCASFHPNETGFGILYNRDLPKVLNGSWGFYASYEYGRRSIYGEHNRGVIGLTYDLPNDESQSTVISVMSGLIGNYYSSKGSVPDPYEYDSRVTKFLSLEVGIKAMTPGGFILGFTVDPIKWATKSMPQTSIILGFHF